MPGWYPLIRAAKYLGVAPWELIEQSVIWQKWAIEAEGAENAARKWHNDHAK
jgi:hypothetical protein